MPDYRKELGKIQVVRFGMGGYQECQLGLSFKIGGEHWGVSDFWPIDNANPERGAKPTFAKIVSELLEEAKVMGIEQLEGVPVQVTFDGIRLDSWRVLKEVL